MPNKIAVTGGIGSGKSAVCRILKERGYPVFSCDEINRTLLSEKSYLDGLCALFPACVKDGKLNKAALSALVFSDKEALKTLNAYAHPRIAKRLRRGMEGARKTCFAEVPLLFESGMTKQFDCAIVVLRNKEERIRAVVARDGLTAEQAKARMRQQFDYDGPLPDGCLAIENDGDEAALCNKVDEVLEALKEHGLL